MDCGKSLGKIKRDRRLGWIEGCGYQLSKGVWTVEKLGDKKKDRGLRVVTVS